MTGRALGRGLFFVCHGGSKVKTRTGAYLMNRFFQHFETAADHYAIVTLLIGLPTAVGAVILASL